MEIEPLIVAMQQIIPLLNGCAWLIDNKGIFRGCNTAQAAIFGNKSEDVVGQSSKTLPFFRLNPGLKAQWENQIQQIIQHQQPVQFELTLQGLDEIPIHYQSLPLFNKNQWIGVLGFSLNENAHSLPQQLRVHKNILDNLPEHVYWKDTRGVYLGCNLNQARDLDLKGSDAIIGKTDYDFSEKKQADAFRAVDKQVISGKKAIEAEEIIEINGTPRVVLSKKIPLVDQTQSVIGVLGISFDITDRKKMEQEVIHSKEKAEAANYLMTEFISNMGHILVTPMSTITGMATELLYGFGDKYLELKSRFEELMQGCVDWDKAYSQVIKSTSLNEMGLKLESFSVNQELLTVKSIMEHNIGTKKLKLMIQPYKPKNQDLIVSDKLKFHLIFIELLSNAIKFTEKGTIKVSILRQEDWFMIEVADTGIGIPPDQVDYIFKQYTMLSRAQKYGATLKGVGAGLFLTEHRAKLLGARITVSSEVGKGSVFTLRIPVEPKMNEPQLP